MTKQEIAAEQDRLKALEVAARASGDRDAALAASRALTAFVMEFNPPKRWGRYRVDARTGKHIGIK